MSKDVIKAKLLSQATLITQQRLMDSLDIQAGSARNLLARWAADGAIVRAAPGTYISAQVDALIQRQGIIESVKQRLGTDVYVIGATAWAHAGWCPHDGTIHLAVPHKPSRALPQINGAKLYPVGAKQFVRMEKMINKVGELKVMDPYIQMMWWMDTVDCPVTMIAPSKINWSVIAQDPLMKKYAVEYWKLDPDVYDIEQIYSMLHIDRLLGRVPGSAEPEDIDETEGLTEDDIPDSPAGP